MRVSIFGLGYVGAVSAGCLALAGHKVYGVDPVKVKIDIINSGRSPIIEHGLDDIISKAITSGRLEATDDAWGAVLDSDISVVCVGTPSQLNGNLDYTAVRRVCEEIGQILADKKDYHVVAVRSTVLPGTIDTVVIPTLEDFSGKKCGRDFGVCMNPEFMRESSAVDDFNNPSLTVIGSTDPKAGDMLQELYSHLAAPVVRTDYKTAEVVKYANNAWHALKIGFANEIGGLCKQVGVDGHAAMKIFTMDDKLNISKNYLLPGFAFGGSCLGKDLRALNYKAKSLDLDLPILSSILPGNRLQVDRAFDMVAATGRRRVGLLGLSFKLGTDDLRESPLVDLAEKLLGKGYDLRIYDRNVNLAKLVGANRHYILNVIPHISKLMVDDAKSLQEHAEVLVVGHNDPEFKVMVEEKRPGQAVVDLVRILDRLPVEGYDGICW